MTRTAETHPAKSANPRDFQPDESGHNGSDGGSAGADRLEAEMSGTAEHRRAHDRGRHPCGRRRDARLDDGRLRLLRRRARLRRGRRGVRCLATRMAFLTTVTLLMRPVGAAIFGLWADRVGRKKVLIIDVCFYSRRRVPVRVRAELHGAAGAAAALRHRHGRRVGSRRVAGDGEGAARASAGWSPASSSRATRSATCSPRSRSC